MRYENIRRAVAEMTWAILPGTLEVILDVLEFRIAGGRLTDEEIVARLEAAAGSRRPRTPRRGGNVALLPLYGLLSQRGGGAENISTPTTSLAAWSDQLDELADDPAIGTIVIDVDSPGGSTDFTPEAAARIRAAREKARIIAVANTMAGSGAYWLASQADELVVTPSGSVGSIGVYATHQDKSLKFEQEGITHTLISSGKFKTELTPFRPLSDEAIAAVQERVETMYGLFVDDVARGRGSSAAKVRDGFGQGRMVDAKAAVAAGMADRVETLDDTIERALAGDGARGGTRADADLAARLTALEERVGPASLLDQEALQEQLAREELAAIDARLRQTTAHLRKDPEAHA